MSAARLPPLPRIGAVYLFLLFVLALGFYALLLISLAAVGIMFYELVIWTPRLLTEVHSLGAIRVLGLLYVAAAVLGWAIVRGIFARAGAREPGMRADLLEHRKLFDVVDDVAKKVGAQTVHEIFLTPGTEIGVWEEAALYMPPGMGKHKIVLGMAALNHLTLDQFRSVLAHEFGHFSNRDTFFSRYIYRVAISYEALVEELRQHQRYYLNPFYWALTGYMWVYELATASFSRQKEFRADRFAVEAFGKREYTEALVVAHLEGAFFEQVALDSLAEAVQQQKRMKNVYHYVGVMRHAYGAQHPDQLRRVLGQIMTRRTGAFDSHPSLGERLKMQGMPTALVQIPTPPRPLPDPELAGQVGPSLQPALAAAPPSAAEELFGANVSQIQARLSDIIQMHFSGLVDLARRANRPAVNV